MIRVLVVGDDDLRREPLAEMVRKAPGMEVVSVVRAIAGADSSLDKCRPDVVLVDISTTNEALLALRAAGRLDTSAVIVAAFGDALAAERRAGHGMEPSYAREVLAAIRIVAGRRSRSASEIVH